MRHELIDYAQPSKRSEGCIKDGTYDISYTRSQVECPNVSNIDLHWYHQTALIHQALDISHRTVVRQNKVIFQLNSHRKN
jgi:hypothetical protein